MRSNIEECYCKNVMGFYLRNDSDIAVYAHTIDYVRVISISTHFLLEKCSHDFFDLPYLRGTYFDIDKSHIIIFKLDSKRAEGSGIFIMPTLEKLIELNISERINAMR